MDEFKEKLAALTESINQKEREIRNLRKSVDSLWDELEELISQTAQNAEPKENAAAHEHPPTTATEGQAIPTDAPTESTNAVPLETGGEHDEAYVNSDPEPPSDEPAETGTPAPAEETPSESDIRESIESESRSMMVDDRPSIQERTGERRTVGDLAALKRVGDLKKAMGINERFLYANELFGGDMNAFSQAIQELNHISSQEDANRMIDEQLAPKYRWDEESEVTEHFRNLVARRFA